MCSHDKGNSGELNARYTDWSFGVMAVVAELGLPLSASAKFQAPSNSFISLTWVQLQCTWCNWRIQSRVLLKNFFSLLGPFRRWHFFEYQTLAACISSNRNYTTKETDLTRLYFVYKYMHKSREIRVLRPRNFFLLFVFVVFLLFFF